MKRHKSKSKLGQKIQAKKMKLDARNIKVIEEDFIVTNKMLVRRMFNGRKQLELKDILNLRE